MSNIYIENAPKTVGLHPTLKRYRDHLYEIVCEHKIRVMEVKEMPLELGATCVATRAVMLAQICDDTGYAIALHEFGHIIAPYGNGISQGTLGDINDPVHLRQMLVEEYAAWEWAEANAVEWTLAMEQTKVLALGSYQDQLNRLLDEQHAEVA